MNISDPVKNEKFIIAIGASKGGLTALYEFFDNTLPDAVSYVITTHLYPHQKSLLTEMIRRHSKLEVYEIITDMPIEPNKVYVMPENNVVRIKQEKLILEARDLSVKINWAIDIFFNSLAETTHFRKVAIILSGMGTDGTLGVEAIANSGGLIIVQDNSALENSMPDSAISAGYVNLTLQVSDMPQAIIDYVNH